MRTVQFDSKWIRLSVFGGLILAWLLLVAYFWRTGRNQLGAAAVGAGPLALYSFYDEIVNKPVLKVRGEVTYEKTLVRGCVDGQTLTNHYDTDAPIILNEPIEAIYPVIYAEIPIANEGLKTAESCTTRVLTQASDPYFGRWGDEANEQSIDIHPGSSRSLTLMRFTPSNININQIGNDRGREYIVTRVFDVLEPGYTGEGVEIDEISFYVQHPVHQSKEQRKLGDDQGTFFGRQVEAQRQYEIDVELGASDWGRTVEDIGPVDVENGVHTGEWETSFQMYDRYTELVDQLESHGW